MRSETAAALHRINLDFYDRHATAFSVTRAAPWPGWERVAEAVESRVSAARPSVLDLGCGNGRLAGFLEGRWRGRFDYLGIDSSAALLELASTRRTAADCRFIRHDLLAEGLRVELPRAPFDLIAVFGVMHHVPGAANRRALLEGAASLLAPGGLLAVSFWQFGDRERFGRRVVSWEEYNRGVVRPIDISDLEPGDQLLAWGQDSDERSRAEVVRYCSWVRPAEADRLLTGLPLGPVAAYSADGAGDDQNHYRLLGAG